ncbi:MAG: zinc-ribbon domain-containing protein, partial [Myxococcota bacterium]
MIDLPPHQVSCPSCGRQYLIDLELVPKGGARIACRRCGERFTVHPVAGIGRSDGSATPTGATPAGVVPFGDTPVGA